MSNFNPGDKAPKLTDSALQAAVSDMKLSERYSADAIQRRVSELEAEAELLRKLRRDE